MRTKHRLHVSPIYYVIPSLTRLRLARYVCVLLRLQCSKRSVEHSPKRDTTQLFKLWIILFTASKRWESLQKAAQYIFSNGICKYVLPSTSFVENRLAVCFFGVFFNMCTYVPLTKTVRWILTGLPQTAAQEKETTKSLSKQQTSLLKERDHWRRFLHSSVALSSHCLEHGMDALRSEQ